MKRLETREGTIRMWGPLGLLLVCGCAQFQTTRIDPTGERILVSGPPAAPSPSVVDSEFRNVPGPMPSSGASAVILCPRDTVAPVGSEVVLLAAVRGFDQYLRTNERVEWMLAPQGVGQFVELDKGSWTNPFVGDFTQARKIDNSYAVNSTSRRLLRLTRGTPGLEDDVHVLRGQAWITVTSPLEGISTVTAFAPNVYGWPCRKQSATIHWVDAEWSFPAPAINTAGTRRTLTTTVARHTDHSPREGWLVRYSVVDGPAAAFASGGSQTVEVLTDAMGQASVEIFQGKPAAGTNQIAIQVIRPEGPRAADGQPQKRLPVGTGCVLQTWSAGDLSLRNSGPAAATVGSVAAYRIEVSNPGDLPISDVVVTEPEPAGMTYVRGTPSPERTGGTIRWRLGSVAAGQTQTLEVEFRADREGTVELCAEAAAANGLSARQCVTTTVTKPAATITQAPKIEVRISGPERATVGDDVTFALTISNRGQVPAAGLIIKDTFDAGLEHSQPGRTIERELGRLGAWESKEIGIEFRVAEPGRLCHTVQIRDAGGVRATASACVEASEPPRAAPPPVRPGPEPADTYPSRPAPETSAAPGSEGPARYPAYPPPPETPMPSVPPIRTGPAETTAPSEPSAPYAPDLRAEPSPISINITATPEVSRLGEETKFTTYVTNIGDVTLNDVVVTCTLDESFDGRNALATPGNHWVDNNVIELNVGTLNPGQLAWPFDIKCRCLRESDRACVRASVTSREGAVADGELCVQILADTPPPANGVSLTVEDLTDPVAQGRELTYLIRVVNHGAVEDRNVTLQVTLPPEVAVDRLKTVGPPRVDYDVDGPILFFEPVETIAAREILEYRVRVRTRAIGTAVLEARLSSLANPVPLVEKEKTLIFAEMPMAPAGPNP